MPTPTITFRSRFSNQAREKAQKMGVPLSLVLNNALRVFLNSDDTVIIGNPKEIKLSAKLQHQADELGRLARKAIAKKRSN
jgi:hypothetical protein